MQTIKAMIDRIAPTDAVTCKRKSKKQKKTKISKKNN